jgi:predicted Zn-dependent protease
MVKLKRKKLKKNDSPTKLNARIYKAVACVGLLVFLLSVQAWANTGESRQEESKFTKLVPPEQIEQQASWQYKQILNDARAHRALAPPEHPLYKRIAAISQRLEPIASRWNSRSVHWHWEVNVIGSNNINAFCMPGGKIAVYSGLMQQLRLSDDEAAMVIGHEMTHAVREHAREQMGKGMVSEGAARVGGYVVAGILGIDPRITDTAARAGAQLLELKFSRQNEEEADLIGMEIAARAGYDPRAAISLWKKMAEFNKGAPPQWLSTHPASENRINLLQKNLSKVLPLYEHALKN